MKVRRSFSLVFLKFYYPLVFPLFSLVIPILSEMIILHLLININMNNTNLLNCSSFNLLIINKQGKIAFVAMLCLVNH